MNLQADKQLIYADIILNIGQYWGNQEPAGYFLDLVGILLFLGPRSLPKNPNNPGASVLPEHQHLPQSEVDRGFMSMTYIGTKCLAFCLLCGVSTGEHTLSVCTRDCMHSVPSMDFRVH